MVYKKASRVVQTHKFHLASLLISYQIKLHYSFKVCRIYSMKRFVS